MHKLLYKLNLHHVLPKLHRLLLELDTYSERKVHCNWTSYRVDFGDIDPKTYKQHYRIYCEFCGETIYNTKDKS